MLIAEFKLFAFFEMTPDLVCIAGKDGYFKKVNPTVIQKLGYTEAELFARPISSFVFMEDKELTQRNRNDLLSGKVLHNFENRYQTKNGNIIWLEWTSIYFPDDEIVFAIAKDITAKKQQITDIEEKYTKFKNLATYFKNNIEKNKKYLAYQLHEELAQLVFAVKMDVDLVASDAASLSELSRKTIAHALDVSKLIISTLQRISFSISPAMLDEFGLDETLKWLGKEFSILNDIPCEIETNYDESTLSHEIKIDFFRICQESLTNIIEHSAATSVKINIEAIENNIRLTITDNGKGFEINQKKDTPGLNSIKERAASINGQLNIESKIGGGTRVCVTVEKQNTALV